MLNTSVVIGSTGLIGRYLIDDLSKKQENIISVSRKPLQNKFNNNEIIETNFNNFLKNKSIPSCDHLYLCLGSTIKKAGSQKEFRKIDFEYSLAFAKQARYSGANKISLVSSVGANHNSKKFYLKVKGELEEAIKEIDFKQINIYRPSLLIGTRLESRFVENFGKYIFFIINFFLWGRLKKYRSISAKKLASFIATSKNKDGINYYYFEDFK